MKRFKKVILWFLIALALFTITGFFIAPPVMKSILINKLSAALDRPVTIGKININPYTLGVRVQGINIKERGGQGTFFSVREIKGGIDGQRRACALQCLPGYRLRLRRPSTSALG